MQRIHQLTFVVALLALSWLAMMAIHEFGHVVGAFSTGGTIKRVVLHPLTISRTDVSPNPHPLTVVWLGPILGCVIPTIVWWFIPRRFTFACNITLFLLGFAGLPMEPTSRLARLIGLAIAASCFKLALQPGRCFYLAQAVFCLGWSPGTASVRSNNSLLTRLWLTQAPHAFCLLH